MRVFHFQARNIQVHTHALFNDARATIPTTPVQWLKALVERETKMKKKYI